MFGAFLGLFSADIGIDLGTTNLSEFRILTPNVLVSATNTSKTEFIDSESHITDTN